MMVAVVIVEVMMRGSVRGVRVMVRAVRYHYCTVQVLKTHFSLCFPDSPADPSPCFCFGTCELFRVI